MRDSAANLSGNPKNFPMHGCGVRRDRSDKQRQPGDGRAVRCANLRSFLGSADGFSGRFSVGEGRFAPLPPEGKQINNPFSGVECARQVCSRCRLCRRAPKQIIASSSAKPSVKRGSARGFHRKSWRKRLNCIPTISEESSVARRPFRWPLSGGWPGRCERACVTWSVICERRKCVAGGRGSGEPSGNNGLRGTTRRVAVFRPTRKQNEPE
jgi:hypothetical protein